MIYRHGFGRTAPLKAERERKRETERERDTERKRQRGRKYFLIPRSFRGPPPHTWRCPGPAGDIGGLQTPRQHRATL